MFSVLLTRRLPEIGAECTEKCSNETRRGNAGTKWDDHPIKRDVNIQDH